MKTAGKIFLYLASALLILWIIPWVWRLATLKPYRTAFTLYSCVVDDFVSVTDGKADLAFVDTKGKVYDGENADSVLPLFYYTDLIARGMLPDTLKGQAISKESLSSNRIVKSSEPADIEKRLPKVWMLMESVPKRVDLEDPAYVIISRRDGFHIVSMEDNKEDAEKTAAFNEALSGFASPADIAAGNPTTRKSYDEGYLMTDAEGTLWHVKMASGKPVVEKFDFPGEKPVKHMIVTEEANRKTLGYVIDATGRMYMLMHDGTSIPTDVIYDPSEKDMLLIADQLNYTVKVSDDKGEDFYALDAEDFSLVDTLHRDYPEDESFNLCKVLFPCRLYFTDGDDSYVKPRLTDFSWIAIVVNLVLAGLWVFFFRGKRKDVWLAAPFVLLCGIFTLIPALLLKE